MPDLELGEVLTNPVYEPLTKEMGVGNKNRGEKRGITAAFRSAVSRARRALGMGPSVSSQPEAPTPPTQQ